MTADELYRRYALGERDFSGVDLSCVNLNIDQVQEYKHSYNELSGINLSGAKLNRANLSFVNLTGANLHSADLTEANLWGTNLTCADLSDAILDLAELGGNLTGANLRESSLYCTRFVGTNLTGADLTGAYLVASAEGRVIFCNTIMPNGSIKSEDY